MPVKSGMENSLEEVIPCERIETIQNQLLIKNIEKRLYTIEVCYYNPQVLTIIGYHLLPSSPGQHWKSKIYKLFSDVHLPHYWILDIWIHPSQSSNEIPNTVYVQCITFRAKMFVKSTLTHFFSIQNANINVYD